jgi:hypothetical protein
VNAAQRALGEIVLDHLIHHPEQHDQSTFGYRDECGTRACVAGWTIVFAQQQSLLEINWGSSAKGILSAVRMPDGEFFDPFDAAQELLGLDDDEACNLFYYGAREPDARAYLRRLLDGAPVPS